MAQAYGGYDNNQDFIDDLLMQAPTPQPKKEKIERGDIRLAIVNSTLVDKNGWVNAEYDYSEELEMAVDNILALFSTKDKVNHLLKTKWPPVTSAKE